MQIWQLACDLGFELCTIADDLADRKFYSFSDQLRRAALSISNNIAEGSGSESDKEFKYFLNYARRSLFECASMLIFFERKQYIHSDNSQKLLPSLADLSKMITSFKRSLSN